MNYELAKELKDAGFPQRGEGKWVNKDNARSMRTGCYAPILSELIEACGGRFTELSRSVDGWYAFTRPIGNIQSYFGSTPEEAVASLWLALNKTS